MASTLQMEKYFGEYWNVETSALTLRKRWRKSLVFNEECIFPNIESSLPASNWYPHGIWSYSFHCKFVFVHLWNKFLDKFKNEDLPRAWRLRHVFRFIVDLIAMNYDDEFSKTYKEIYLEEMELKPENADPQSSSYLNLQIDVDEMIFDFILFW